MRQFKEETRRLSSAKSRGDDAEMAQKPPKLRIREFLRHTLDAMLIQCDERLPIAYRLSIEHFLHACRLCLYMRSYLARNPM